MISEVFIVFISIWHNFTKNLNRSVGDYNKLISKMMKIADGGEEEEYDRDRQKKERRTKI